MSSDSESSHDSESPRKRSPSVFDIDDEIEAAATTGSLSAIVNLEQCPHTSVFLNSRRLLEVYEKVIRWAKVKRDANGPPTKRRKMQLPTCGACSAALPQPIMCLQCQFTGCWKDGHIVSHLSQHGHSFAVDMNSGTMFCTACDDFIASPALRKIYNTISISLEEDALGADRRRRVPYKPWSQTKKDAALLSRSTPLMCSPRRGLLNLGQTCYLNVIVQSILHNPIMKAYFLADQHNWKLCDKTSCMSCEFDKLFTEVYSPTSTPPSSQQNLATGSNNALGPLTLLRTTWENSVDLSGYAQQDAHEFFMSVLNQIHSSSKGASNGSGCQCIVHQAFGGQLQSDVKCGGCGKTNPTVDPMLDISLELKGDQGPVSLASCLRRYTQPEKLAPNSYTCGSCKSAAHESTKRLSIKRLPPVLCIQLKRFEHKSTTGQKIDTAVQFPATLNMAPYTTRGLESQGHTKGNAESLGPNSLYDYDLFAVVNHDGQINNGHYTNFARSNDEWYRFDDDKVSYATLGECLKSPPYMCFYVKRRLEYEPVGTTGTTSIKPPSSSTVSSN